MVDDFKAVDLNGSNESLRSGGRDTFDIANTWTVMVTYKPMSVAGTRTIFHLNDADVKQNDNTILIETRGTNIRTYIVGSLGYGNPAKIFDYENLVVTGTWYQATLTWDGTTLNFYHDGVLQAVSGTVVNNSNLTMTDSVDKSLWLGENKDTYGNEFEGRIHSAAIWNSVLSAATIATITGAATADLSDAQHWWRLGLDPTTSGLGLDYGTSASGININQASSQITAADVITDYPGI